MRRQLTAYLGEEDFHRLREEADERGFHSVAIRQGASLSIRWRFRPDFLGRHTRPQLKSESSSQSRFHRSKSLNRSTQQAHHAAGHARSVRAEHADAICRKSPRPNASKPSLQWRAPPPRMAARGRGHIKQMKRSGTKAADPTSPERACARTDSTE